MAIDGLLLHNILYRLKDLCPCKIGKIQNISDEEILIHLHSAKTGNHKLVINVHSNTNRIYLADTILQVQPSPSNFVMVLRKNFAQGTIESIEQVGFDRIFIFHISARNEFQDLVKVKLYAEIMGKYANLILVNDNNIIIDALKRIPVYENSKRLVHPGALYIAPDPGKKQDPYHVQNLDLDTSFVEQIYGFSPILSKEFIHRMMHGQAYGDILKELMESNTLYVYKKEFHCLELTHRKEEYKSYDLMYGLCHLFDEKEQKVRIKEQCADVFR
ncbi:MAG: fibronectin/fibrinogen-binding protein, partial [Holdemanella sp.]|nr:fibronectin/fibrinogen-binding protein [Holdemanella sp.]